MLIVPQPVDPSICSMQSCNLCQRVQDVPPALHHHCCCGVACDSVNQLCLLHDGASALPATVCTSQHHGWLAALLLLPSSKHTQQHGLIGLREFRAIYS